MSRLADLLDELQQLEKTAASGHAPLILGAFARHTPFRTAAVYFRDGDSGLRLAAQSNCELPDVVMSESDVTLDLVVPLRSTRDHLGLLALSRDGTTDDDVRTAKAAATFVSTLITNQRLATEMREGDFQLKYRLWELESLYDIGLSIAATLNIDELADEVLARMISLMNARRAALFLRDGDRFVLYRNFGDVPSIRDDDYRRLVVTGAPLSFENGTVVSLPIVANNTTIGVLAAADRETRDGIGAFEPNDLRLLSLFASQVGIALENARLHKEALEKQMMQRELELAATIQNSILPKSIPSIAGLDIAALSRPARQVGGDYHAFFDRDGVVTMLVADVAGKSMPAALLVSALHAALQLLFAEGRELGEIATELNKHIHRWSAENKFITMLMVSIDRDAGTLQFVNAGHNPGYLVNDGGQLEQLRSHGLPIGILPNSTYKAQTRPLAPGSAVVIYSDGITEAEDVAGEEFENERLEQILAANAHAGADTLRDRIAAAVDEFVGEAPQKDDQTIVIANYVS